MPKTKAHFLFLKEEGFWWVNGNFFFSEGGGGGGGAYCGKFVEAGNSEKAGNSLRRCSRPTGNETGFPVDVSGHDFSRAANAPKRMRALAPEETGR